MRYSLKTRQFLTSFSRSICSFQHHQRHRECTTSNSKPRLSLSHQPPQLCGGQNEQSSSRGARCGPESAGQLCLVHRMQKSFEEGQEILYRWWENQQFIPPSLLLLASLSLLTPSFPLLSTLHRQQFSPTSQPSLCALLDLLLPPLQPPEPA